ncbi:MAG: hypothetical protein AB7G37_01025 [Solirubrobacteraceae bacterium]
MSPYAPCPRCWNSSGLIHDPVRRTYTVDETATFPHPPKRCPDCEPAPADAPASLRHSHVIRVP